MKFWTKTIGGFAVATVLSCAQATAGVPEKVTFTKDVLPILQNNCQNCHRPLGVNSSGMIAPMSFMDYKQTRPWAKAIAKAVTEKSMPPWYATQEFHGVFRNERTLTADEIEIIDKWVKTGAKRGNPADAPEPIQFPETGWAIGEPDLVVSFDEPFFVPDDAEDLYQNITVELTPEMLPEDRYITALELKPGSEVVHHILAFAISPDGSGRDGEWDTMIGGMAPGTDAILAKEGFGTLLKAGSTLLFQMHYHKEAGPGTGVYDVSHMGFQFADGPIPHPMTIDAVAHRSFEIPPNQSNWKVGAAKIMDEDTLLLGMTPHMHLRGKAAKYTAYYPDGSSEVLLHVPEFDFNWQIEYTYKEPKLLPKGTRIEAVAWFDNSQERADYTYINPDRSVRFGGPTTDEMDLMWIGTAPAEPQPDPTYETKSEEAPSEKEDRVDVANASN